MNSKRVAGFVVAIVVVTLWLHWPAVQGKFLHWDDPLYLKNVAHWQKVSWSSVRWAFSTTGHDYYSPLTWLSYLIDHQTAGLDPHRFHATNVVIHALNTGVVGLLVWMIAARSGAGPVARHGLVAGVALVFGLHPLQVESVAWVAERKNVLSSHFALWSLCAYLQAERTARPKLWRSMALLLFALALLAKPQVMTLPLVMLALDLYPLRRWPATGWRRLISEKTGFWLLSFACGLLTVYAVFQVETPDPTTLAGIQQRCLVAMRGVIFYIWKLAWPAWLSPFYPLEGEISIRVPEFAVTTVLFLAVCGFALRSVKRLPAWTSAWVAFLALLLPVIGLVQTGNQAAADRYMYLALLPLSLVAAAAVAGACRKCSVFLRSVLVVFVGCYLLFLAWTTRAQIPVWRNDLNLWHAAYQRFPESGYVNTALANALRRQGQLTDALPFAQRAVELAPQAGQARESLGVIHLLLGHYDDAVKELETAAQLNPRDLMVAYNLACAYSRHGQLSRAWEILERILPRRPDLAEVAARDVELADLRKDSVYGPRFTALLGE